jgi:prepilin-type processing-associated H-X9-DG protein
LSNTKQIALAFQIYTQDYDDCTPGGCFAQWAGCTIDENGLPKSPSSPPYFTALWPLRPYVKNGQVFICPSITGWNRSDFRPQKGSYASNRTAAQEGYSIASFDQPSRTVAFVDCYTAWIDDVVGFLIHCRLGHYPYCWFYSLSPSVPCRPDTCSNARSDWHNEGINVVYVDGHAKWSKPANLTYGQFLVGPQWGLDVTNPKYNCPITVWPRSCSHPGP